MLAHMEKDAKSWRSTRWVVVLMAGVCVIAGLWMGSGTVDRFQRAFTAESAGAPVTGLDLAVSSVDLVGLLTFWAGWVFLLALGGVLLVHTLSKWHKGRREEMLIKMARSWVESQKAEQGMQRQGGVST